MNKFGMVIGVAAVAVIAGCKDPDYKHGGTTTSQNEVKLAGGDNVAKPVDIATKDVSSAQARHCTCAPGTRHTKPCACGAADCMCVVESKPAIKADLSKPAPVAVPAEPETTVYIVQSGDYLAKISKKFNVTISSIKKLNPSIKENNVVRVGQKIKLPGKIDVGEQKEPAKAVAARPAKKAYAPYAGATKEYVVKSGDTLGAIAYSNGINIRQLKELNGLTKDTLRIGQKLKIPAEKVVAAKPVAKTPAKPAVAKTDAKKPAAATKAAEPAAETAPAETSVETAPAETSVETAPAETSATTAPAETKSATDATAPATTTYVVQQGDDMTGVSIRWGVSAADIRELNNLGDKDQLVPGQIIKLPADAQQ